MFNHSHKIDQDGVNQIKPDTRVENLGNNKSGTQPRRKDTLWSLTQPETSQTGVADVAKIAGDVKSKDFSKLNVEAIIEPLPKSVDKERTGRL